MTFAANVEKKIFNKKKQIFKTKEIFKEKFF